MMPEANNFNEPLLLVEEVYDNFDWLQLSSVIFKA